METSRVLTMLNAQASRQLENKQFEAAKRTVNEAIRYYEDSKSVIRSRGNSGGPHEDALVRCQAQVSILLQLKIGRREAAIGAQTQNDRLSQSAQRMISQSTRSLRGIMHDSQTIIAAAPATASNVSPAEYALSELKQASLSGQPAGVLKTKDSTTSSHYPRVNIPLPTSEISAATKPTALEEWFLLSRTVQSPYSIPSNINIINNCSTTTMTMKDDSEDGGFCDCFAQIKRKALQHADLQSKQTPTPATTITSPTSSKATSVDEMVELQTKSI